VADAENKINDYIKEQWVVARAKEEGVPVANILEVGIHEAGKPYMLQEKMDGMEAADHPDRLKILKEIGRLARIIHQIPTSNYGVVFDWSENQLSKNNSWEEFLRKEIDVSGRLEIFHRNKIFSTANFKKFRHNLHKISKWKKKPTLNHGDLRLKNVIINDAGKILGVIDWENASSNIAPYWDFSIALHDLSVDAKQEFLEGYGIKTREFSRMAYALKVFNIINYAPKIQHVADRKEHKTLELYRMRLNGYLDLYSL
jgi:hygromycin-B 4-O-kinase